MGYNILSPDGITIAYTNFPTEQTAYAFFLEWKKQFEKQGFYFAVGATLMLKDLADYCQLVEYSENGIVFNRCYLCEYIEQINSSL